MDMDIDNVEPATTQVTSTLATTHPDVAQLDQETNQQKIMITHMEQQIQNLQKLVQDLVKYKTQEEEAKENFNHWKQGIAEKLIVVGGGVQETKKGQATLQQDMTNMQQTLDTITKSLQGGALSQPQPAKLHHQNESATISQHPDPPPQGSGNI